MGTFHSVSRLWTQTSACMRNSHLLTHTQYTKYHMAVFVHFVRQLKQERLCGFKLHAHKGIKGRFDTASEIRSSPLKRKVNLENEQMQNRLQRVALAHR